MLRIGVVLLAGALWGSAGAQARTAIMDLLQQQERYMTQNNCYLGFTNSAAGVATASAPVPSTAT